MTLSYSGELLRQHDKDRFLLALFAPAERREIVFALYAFNHEIAKTRDVVTEDSLGLIRLQWWREEIEKMYEGSPISHQVLEPLQGASLSQEYFEQLIAARERDLEAGTDARLKGILEYLDQINTPLSYLVLEALEVEITPELKTAVQHAAQAYMLMRVILSTYFETQKPSKEDIEKLAGTVQGHIDQSRGASVPGAAMPVMLQTTLAEQYFRKLKSVDYDIGNPKLMTPVFLRELRLLFRAMRRKY